MKTEFLVKGGVKKIEGPVIVVANHKSYSDHWFLGSALISKFGPSLLPMRFFTAERFFKKWWSCGGFLMRLSGAIPAKRGVGLQVSLGESMEILRNNGTLIFYPEGGITRDENVIREPKRGIGALALWSGAKILPVAIKGSSNRKNGVKVITGSPFYIKDIVADKLKNSEEDYVLAANAIMDKVKELYRVDFSG